MTTEREDYVATFEKFWRELVCNSDGTLNRDAVMRELHDYNTVLEEVPKVYDHITGGIFSKPNTRSAVIIDAAEAHYAEAYSTQYDEEYQ